MHALTRLRRSPRLALVVLVGLLAAVAVAVAYAAQGPDTAIPAPTPQFADQMTNIDVLRQEIKDYYGVPLATTGSKGSWAAGFAADSNYVREAENVAADGEHWLAAKANAKSTPEKKAIVLDIDDTTLATFNYELYSNWDYNPSTNADFVNNERFPAVPGMVDMVNQAKGEGYAIIFLTGRPGDGTPDPNPPTGFPGDQELATLGNLAEAGYPAPDEIFLKPDLTYAGYPSYLKDACGAGIKCSTIQYKSATRKYIEQVLGYDIVANFGDQYSDFTGGYSDRTFKLPNPSYYLP